MCTCVRMGVFVCNGGVSSPRLYCFVAVVIVAAVVVVVAVAECDSRSTYHSPRTGIFVTIV